jgi:hypothetical protein
MGIGNCNVQRIQVRQIRKICMNTGFSFFLSSHHPNISFRKYLFFYSPLFKSAAKTILRQEMPLQYFFCLRIVLHWRSICQPQVTPMLYNMTLFTIIIYFAKVGIMDTPEKSDFSHMLAHSQFKWQFSAFLLCHICSTQHKYHLQINMRKWRRMLCYIWLL